MKGYYSLLVALIISVCVANGQAWLEVPYKLDAGVRTMYWDSTSGWFYVAGNMSILNGKKVQRMFRFNNDKVVDYMDTVNPNMETVLALVKYKDTLYHFGYAGMWTYYNFTWHDKLFKPQFPVFYNAHVYKGELLIGGNFREVVNPNDGVVMKYNGHSFSPFYDAKTIIGGPKGQDGSVNAFAEYKGKLYMGGNFETSGDFNEIISWDGMGWDNMHRGIPGNSGFENVSDLVVYKGDLYVGGKFLTENGSRSNHILKWDGFNWYTLGEGLFGQGISDMLVYRDELWVIGALDSAKGVQLGNIGIWNGSYWCNSGGLFDFMPDCGAVFGDTLYIGGFFEHVNGDSSLSYIVKYNPNSVRECGDPVEIKLLSVEDGFVSKEKRMKLYPNPSHGELTLDFSAKQLVEITIHSFSGELMVTEKLNNQRQVKINLPTGLANGMYLLQVKGINFVTSERFILMK